MTDNEIIKALECHNTCNLSSCRECPLYDTGKCSVELCGYALDLINRQQAESENQSENFKRLVAEHRKLQTNYSSMQSTLAKMSMGVEQAKAKAIKEFAERLKAKPIKCSYPLLWLSTKDEITDCFNDIMMQFKEAIDTLVKEMVGDTE